MIINQLEFVWRKFKICVTFVSTKFAMTNNDWLIKLAESVSSGVMAVRAEPIVPKNLPFQISTSFSLLFQHI